MTAPNLDDARLLAGSLRKRYEADPIATTNAHAVVAEFSFDDGDVALGAVEQIVTRLRARNGSANAIIVRVQTRGITAYDSEGDAIDADAWTTSAQGEITVAAGAEVELFSAIETAPYVLPSVEGIGGLRVQARSAATGVHGTVQTAAEADVYADMPANLRAGVDYVTNAYMSQRYANGGALTFPVLLGLETTAGTESGDEASLEFQVRDLTNGEDYAGAVQIGIELRNNATDALLLPATHSLTANTGADYANSGGHHVITTDATGYADLTITDENGGSNLTVAVYAYVIDPGDADGAAVEGMRAKVGTVVFDAS